MTTRTAAFNGHGSAVVTALNEAICAAMNEFGDRHGCRPMYWYLPEVHGSDRGSVIGFPGVNDQDPADGVRLAQAWATLLGLAKRADEPSGRVAWIGRAGATGIEIWCET